MCGPRQPDPVLEPLTRARLWLPPAAIIEGNLNAAGTAACPTLVSPQTRTRPSSRSATACSAPAAMARILVASGGTLVAPSQLPPQAATVPSNLRPRLNTSPAAIATRLVAESGIGSGLLKCQPKGVPSHRNNSPYSWAAAIAVMLVASSGGNPVFPQARTVPSCRSTRLKRSPPATPVEIATTFVASVGTWIRPDAVSPQAITRPSLLKATLCV